MSGPFTLRGQGFIADGGRIVREQNPFGVISDVLGFPPDFHVQGDLAQDAVSEQNLIQVGTAAANTATVRLIDAAPPLPMVTGALDFPLANDAYDAWNSTVNDIGTETELIIVTWKVRTIPATRNICGKFETGVAGYELKLSSDGKAQLAVQVQGQIAETTELIGPFLVDIWHTTAGVIDRLNNKIIIGSTDEAALEAGNEASMSIVSGTIANASTYAIGKQRLQAIDGQVLHVTHARGSKVDSLLATGKGPKLISRDIARLMWADTGLARIT